MSVEKMVSNTLVQDESSVWVLDEHKNFGYSDGVESERYLEKVFKSASDLSSGSPELETYIKDWPSEYHLTSKRAQLFAGFEFDSSLKVLEVGGGCGAITRYLGETFDEVVSVEGSIHRARLARLRTAGMENVSIICSPFQEIQFTEIFDIIFCVGVYEYSSSFVSGDDPYDAVLAYFCDLLTPTGMVVIAIENQFGLKYFNAAREDHTGTLFEGLEGYRVYGEKVRTFGKKELECNLKKYFSAIEMYYPYPDYKLPTCIATEEFLASPGAGELVSQIGSRDYGGDLDGQWDESLVTLELSKNGMLPFFSNSFLAFAAKSKVTGASFDQLALFISARRTPKFRTVTRIVEESEGVRSAIKSPMSGDDEVREGKLRLRESRSDWVDGRSLQAVLIDNCLSGERRSGELFAPCKVWIHYILENCEEVDGVKLLDGSFIDCTFANVFIDGGKVSVIDWEWNWTDKLRVNFVVVRAVFLFLATLHESRKGRKSLGSASTRKLTEQIALTMGIRVDRADFDEFVELESTLQSIVLGERKERRRLILRWVLWNRASYRLVQNGLELWRRVVNRFLRIGYRVGFRLAGRQKITR